MKSRIAEPDGYFAHHRIEPIQAPVVYVEAKAPERSRKFHGFGRSSPVHRRIPPAGTAFAFVDLP
jgi:hypothetical protein